MIIMSKERVLRYLAGISASYDICAEGTMAGRALCQSRGFALKLSRSCGLRRCPGPAQPQVYAFAS